MGIQNFSENIIIVDLPSDDAQIAVELKDLNERIHGDNDCDVIIDCARVEIITSSNISNLLALRDLLRENGKQLIFCNVTVPTKGIFTVAGLDGVFEFALDRDSALTAIEQSRKGNHSQKVSS